MAHKSISTRATPLLWLVPVLVIAVPVAIMSFAVPWQASYGDGGATYLQNLPRQPLWSPPAAPSISVFESTFSKSFSERQTSPGLVVQPKVEQAAVELVLMIALACLACVPFYLASGSAQRPRSLPLRVCAFAAVGAAAGAAACFTIWTLVGGWGPPAPAFFGGAGLLIGASAGLLRPVRRRVDGIACRRS